MHKFLLWCPILSSKIKKNWVGLGTTLADSGYANGNTFFQAGTNATGNLVGTAGTAAGTLSIANAGIGYTPTDGDLTFSGVDLVTRTGKGSGAKANITVVDGVAVAATCVDGGQGYTAGDVLTVDLGDGAGEGIRLTVESDNIESFNELILTDVQGDFDTSASAYSLRYVDNALGIGTVINWNGTAPIEVKPTSTTVSDGDDGLHLKIRMKNHGMYNSINKVTLTDIESDLVPSTITQNYSRTSTANLGVLAGAGYTTFEGLTVGAAQTGYIRIEDEINWIYWCKW